MEQQNKYRVIVSARAAQMLVSHAAFLAQVSPAAAERLTVEFEKAAKSLEQIPQRCPWLRGEYIPKNAYRLMANVSQLYEELISYADLYDSASFEAKKMIVSQLIRRVDVYRGYQIHVDFNFDLAQYLENSDELAC